MSDSGSGISAAIERMHVIAKQHSTDVQLGSMEHGELAAAAVGIADTLDAMAKGQVSGNPTERAYLAGALAALRGVLMSQAT